MTDWRPRTFAEAVAELSTLKIVPLVRPKPLGSLTVEQDGQVVAVEEFDRVALDEKLAPRAAELRFRTLHVGAELWPLVLRDLDLGPHVRPDLDGVRRLG